MSSPNDPSSLAERLFGEWLASSGDRDQDDLERLCRAHPAQSGQLRVLRDQWVKIHSIIQRREPVHAELLQRLARYGDSSSRYRVEGEIGRGSMGVVLRVQDEHLRRSLAMKVALGASGGSGESPGQDLSVRELARFLEEAEVTGQLDHPGIVPIHELGLDAEGRVYFTMRLVEGKTLRDVFDELARGDGEWTQTRVLGLILKVCDAMSYAHAKGVIHRDLKPGNVMVGQFGEVYVMDWGLAKILGRNEERDLRIRSPQPATEVRSVRHEQAGETPDSPLITMDGDVVGTPAYMSPEQAMGRVSEMGPHSDVYAAGAVLYHLLTGHMPYVRTGETGSSRDVWRSVKEGPPPAIEREARNAPSELVAICERAMAREHARRYVDMAALAGDLRAYLEHRVVQAYRTGALAELRKWIERNKLLAAAVVALVLGAALYAIDITRSQAETTEALRRTRALGLATASDEVLESDTMLALLLARKAVEVDRTPETLSRLHQALGASRERGVVPHTEALVDAVFSPGGDKVLGLSNGVALLADLDGSEPVGEPVPLEGHTTWLTSASFSTSGEHVLTSSQDGTARLWDLGGNPLAQFDHGSLVWVAALSPDERYVLTAAQDGTAKLWDRYDAEEPLAVLEEHDGAIRAASFAPHDGLTILTASVDGTGRLWTFQEENGEVKCSAVLEGHEGPITCAGFSPDGERIVTASGIEGIWSMSGIPDDTARVWDLQGRELAVLRGHTNGVEWAVFSPDGKRILTASSDQTGRLWDVEGRWLAEYRIPSSSLIWRCSFAPNSRFVAFGCADGTGWLFDVSGKPIGTLAGHKSAVNSVRFSPDSRWIATASLDKTVRLWSVLDDTLPTYYGHRGGVYRAVYSPDGTKVATVSADRTVRVWDTLGHPLGPPLRGHDHTVFSVEFSPDGERLVTASRDKTARIWQLPDKQLRVLSHDPEVKLVSDASFSPDGNRIVTGCRDGTVVVWEADTGKVEHRLSGMGMVEHVEFAPSGGQLLIARMYGPPVIVPLDDDSETVNLKHMGNLATFSPNGDRILIASTEGKGKALLTSVEGDVLQEFGGHEAAVKWASFSPDGTQVVTASMDGTARIWKADGTLRAALRGHAGGLFSAVFSPKGDRILTASRDGTAQTWVVDTDELIELAESRTIRRFTQDELRRYHELFGGGQ